MSENAIVGEVRVPRGTIAGVVSATQTLIGHLNHEACLVGAIVTAYSSGGVKYEGDYEVTPTVDGLELNTKDKYMSDDVTIRAIPFYEVSNTSGGNTVYIAGEIEME